MGFSHIPEVKETFNAVCVTFYLSAYKAAFVVVICYPPINEKNHHHFVSLNWIEMELDFETQKTVFQY